MLPVFARALIRLLPGVLNNGQQRDEAHEADDVSPSAAAARGNGGPVVDRRASVPLPRKLPPDAALARNPDHDDRGRFTSGNRAARKAGSRKAFRDVIYAATTREDVAVVWVKLMLKAQGGNLKAIAMVLDRVCGRVEEVDTEERVQRMEALVGRLMTADGLNGLRGVRLPHLDP